MATKEDLMGVGLSWPEADRLGFSPVNYTPTASITVQASATQIQDKLATLTVSTSTAVSFLLPQNPAPGIFVYCTNLFASTATASVFPSTGAFLNGATNTAVTLLTAQSAVFFTTKSGTAANITWYSIKSA